MTLPVTAALFGLAGLLVGSFLNVCIHRLPRQESMLCPASHCPECSRPLAWFENIPVVSWFVLRGRCRVCRASISMMYPATELATALLFVSMYAIHGVQMLLVARVLFGCALIVLFVIDLRHRILPDLVTLPGIAAGFGASFLLPPGPVASLLGIALGGGILFGLSEAYYRLRGHEGLGMGDVKMLAMIGAFLGWRLVLATLFLASLSGSLVGLVIVLSGRGGMKSQLPFGVFLSAGALISTLGGAPLLAWYLSLYR
jgi:leader peptidase (prepilin peptidase)/N-methyltransferase